MAAASARRLFPSTPTGFGSRERLAAACLAAILCLLLVSRLAGLGLSLWNDEIVTVVRYVLPGPEGIWGPYRPNNHVLFSLVTWLTTLGLGTGEATLRLWSVVPGLLATGVLSWWAWRRLGPGVSVVVALLATTSPLFLELHTEARGYGLTTLAAVLLIVVSDRLLRDRPGRRAWIAYGGAALLGITAHIAFLACYVAQSLTLSVLGHLRRGVVVSILCVGLASAIFYGPMLGQMANALSRDFGDAGSPPTRASYAALEPAQGGQEEIGGQSTGKPGVEAYPPLPWHAPLTGPVSLLAPSVELAVLGRVGNCHARCYTGLAFVVFVLPVLICWLAGVADLWSRGRRRLLLLLACPPALAFLLLTLPQGFVVDRFVSYTMPYTLVLVGVGIVAVVQRLSAVRFARPLVVAAAAAGVGIGLAQFVGMIDGRSRVPFENPGQVARVIDRWGGGPVFTNSRRAPIFEYYLGRDRVLAQRPEMLRATLCSTAAPFAFIHHRYRSRSPDLSCLARRRHERVRVPQRGRGRRIDVYLVAGPVRG